MKSLLPEETLFLPLKVVQAKWGVFDKYGLTDDKPGAKKARRKTKDEEKQFERMMVKVVPGKDLQELSVSERIQFTEVPNTDQFVYFLLKSPISKRNVQ